MSFSNTAEGMIVTTSNYVPGFAVSQVLGIAAGITVRSRGLGGQFIAGLRGMLGGEIKEFVENAEKARSVALQKMVEHAKSMGADAVIQVYFDSNELSQSMDEIIAYGTAVKLVQSH